MLHYNPIVSIIIVNYNAGNMLKRCLESILSQTYMHWEVIIVDNDSDDDSLENLPSDGRIRVIRNHENLGFAKGQNQGIALAKGDYILSLNFDLILSPLFLERMVKNIDGCKNVGWATPKMLNMSKDYSPQKTIYAVGHILPPNRFALLRGNGEVDHGQYNIREFVFGAPGAAALYTRELIDDISFDGQFFDEVFFAWYEDVDIDWRAQNRGWQCLYVPDAVAYHVGHVGEEYVEPYKSWRASIGIRNRWLLILANETRRNFVKNFFPLLIYELKLLKFVVIEKLFLAYLNALVSFLRFAPRALRKRRLFLPKIDSSK